MTLDDGQVLTRDRFAKIQEEELSKLRDQLGADRYDRGHFNEAAKMFFTFSTSDELADFLTLPAYERLVQSEARM